MLIHWIWFATRTGMGDKTKAVLLSHFEDPEAIYFAPELEFERFGELSGSAVESMMDKDLTECEQILAQCQEKVLKRVARVVSLQKVLHAFFIATQ